MTDPESVVVLVIDDDKAVCQALSLHLKYRGMTVETALTGQEGLARLRRGGIGLVLTDVGLPDLSGHQLIRRATEDLGRAGLPLPEFVVMTANPTMDNAVEAFDEGASQFIQKPVSTRFLDAVIKRALEVKGYRDAAQRAELAMRDCVIGALPAATENVGLVGALEAVLRAANVLLRPSQAALWVTGPDGHQAMVAGDTDASLGAEHEDVAKLAWERQSFIRREAGERVYAGQPLLLDNQPEGVLCVEYAAAVGGEEPPADVLMDTLRMLADHAAAAIRRERLFTDLRASSVKIQSLFEVGLAMASEHSLQRLFEVIVDSAARICGAERCSLMVKGEEPGILRMRAARGIPADVVRSAAAKVGEGIAGNVAATGEPLFIADIETDRRFGRHNASQYRNNSLVCVPIRLRDGVAGVLSVNNKADGSSFTTNDLNLMTLLASQAAVAIDNAERYQDLSQRAITDGLTGLYLRRYFDECLEMATVAATAGGRGHALLMVDIDHFKRINDTYGHPVGDEVLRAVAEVIKSAVREQDLVARYGGEEFGVIVSSADPGVVRVVAERVRRAIETAKLGAGETTLQATASVGAAVWSASVASAAALVEAADEALYQAKHTGRNKVCLAGEEATS